MYIYTVSTFSEHLYLGRSLFNHNSTGCATIKFTNNRISSHTHIMILHFNTREKK